MLSGDFHGAYKFAAELHLISKDDENFLIDLQLSKIDFTDDPEQWIQLVNKKIADLEILIHNNRYAQYRNGGPKPLRQNGLPDWAEKERYGDLQHAISAYAVLGERITNFSIRNVR